MHFYNEHDPKAAAWLRELIKQRHISEGVVDERSIEDISSNELGGFVQCHFFAGIGGWPLALKLAGWPEDRPVWTGSCPCQPFSVAGKQMGRRDSRHLWPAFRRLINRCRPSTIFGEQVASKDGRIWLAGVFANLETMGYAPAGADLCAAGVGAPHIRQRLFWVANSDSERHVGEHALLRAKETRRVEESLSETTRSGEGGGLGNTQCQQHDRTGTERGRWCESANDGGLGYTEREGREGQSFTVLGPGGSSYRSESEWLPCADGKSRRIESGLKPLAHGIPARVVRLRGYGNAIVPQVAAEFIQAYCEVIA